MGIDWNAELLSQLTWHWDNQLRPRLAGLTDEEYFWDPAAEMWNVRPLADVRTGRSAGAGDWQVEFEFPEPSPAPLTTIGWRICHVLGGVLGLRVSRHFGSGEVDLQSYVYPGTAAEALDQWDGLHRQWIAGVTALGADGLEKPCGEPDFEDLPMAALVLHIHREVLHHGAEIALMRDLYPWHGAVAG